jgi:hypothetical protein
MKYFRDILNGFYSFSVLIPLRGYSGISPIIIAIIGARFRHHTTVTFPCVSDVPRLPPNPTFGNVMINLPASSLAKFSFLIDFASQLNKSTSFV